MRVEVDDSRCGGHGTCCALCPDVFEVTDDGYAIVRTSDVPAPLEDKVREAVAQCPERAISVTL